MSTASCLPSFVGRFSLLPWYAVGMEENPYKAPTNFGQQSRWPLPNWKWYEWIVVAIIVAISAAILWGPPQYAIDHGLPPPASESADDPPA
jgi:hypothetical protein